MRFKYKKIIISASFSVMLLGMVVFSTKKSVVTGTEGSKSVAGGTTVVENGSSYAPIGSNSSSGSSSNVDRATSSAGSSEGMTDNTDSPDNAKGISILMKNAYPEVNKLVEEYLEARLKVDENKIAALVDNVNYAGIDELHLIMKNFESIRLDGCYTIDGPEEKAKMVYAKSSVKIKGIDTMASSIDGFYVRADEGGEYKIILSPLPDEVQKIIDEDIKRGDVSALLSDVNTQFAREIKSDKKLADFYKKLQNREAGSNEDIKVSDGKDEAKSKKKEDKPAEKSKNNKKATKSKKNN